MGLKHKVTINVREPSGTRRAVIESNRKTARSRLVDFLLGKKVSLLLITPGDSVETVEIKEIKEVQLINVNR